MKRLPFILLFLSACSPLKMEIHEADTACGAELDEYEYRDKTVSIKVSCKEAASA